MKKLILTLALLLSIDRGAFAITQGEIAAAGILTGTPDLRPGNIPVVVRPGVLGNGMSYSNGTLTVGNLYVTNLLSAPGPVYMPDITAEDIVVSNSFTLGGTVITGITQTVTSDTNTVPSNLAVSNALVQRIVVATVPFTGTTNYTTNVVSSGTINLLDDDSNMWYSPTPTAVRAMSAFNLDLGGLTVGNFFYDYGVGADAGNYHTFRNIIPAGNTFSYKYIIITSTNDLAVTIKTEIRGTLGTGLAAYTHDISNITTNGTLLATSTNGLWVAYLVMNTVTLPTNQPYYNGIQILRRGGASSTNQYIGAILIKEN